MVMAALLFPVEHLVLKASTRGVAAGLGLLAAEAVLAAALYVGALRLLAPATGGMIVRLPAMLLSRLRNGGPRSDAEEGASGEPLNRTGEGA
jgi:hypothetical protein